MHLTPSDTEKLLLAVAGMVARDRLDRGVRLNYPEAVALLSCWVIERAREGRSVADLMQAGRHDEALRYWRDEYRLNASIKRYRKPYVSIVDGIMMGGGVGLAIHGSHRVAGDGFRFAMPEVGVGFFPDIGATWFLPRLPGETGTYCALTGERIDAADATALRIATHRVPSPRLPELLDGLCGTVPVDALLAAFAEPVTDGPMQANRPAIDRLFGADRVEDILSALDAAAVAAGPDAGFARLAAATAWRTCDGRCADCGNGHRRPRANAPTSGGRCPRRSPSSG